MRRILRVLLVALIAGGSLAVLTPSLAQGTKGKKYALLVGVNEYDSNKLCALRFPENDVEELAKVLEKSGEYAEIRVLTCKRGQINRKARPTGENIRAALEHMLRDRTRHDSILVAMAGHGVQLLVMDPRGELPSRPYTFFCPSDSNLNDVKFLTGLSDTMLNLDVLFKTLGDSNPGSKLVLMDACRNELAVTASTRSLASKQVEVPNGVLALFSCGRDQFAYESPKLGHGVFFYYVLEGLRGKAANKDDEVTWASLTDYATRQVPRNVARLIGGGASQTPAVYGSHEGETPLLVRIQPSWDKEIDSASTKMKLVRILNKGDKITFKMGSPVTEKQRNADEQQHEVELTRPYWIGKYEVTQGEYRKVMGYNPSYFSRDGRPYLGSTYTVAPAGGKNKIPLVDDTDRYPVENVTWHDARLFCEKLTLLDRGRVYTLPTEAEWEYACRGPSRDYQPFHFGDRFTSVVGNFNGEMPYSGADKGLSLDRTCTVGSFRSNQFGLHDMHGNVSEWCVDKYSEDFYAPRTMRDPENTSGRKRRVIRGGSWRSDGHRCRSAYRGNILPSHRDNTIGFRVVASPAR